jgi:hypothetical protein
LVCETVEDARKVAFGGQERHKVWIIFLAISKMCNVNFISYKLLYGEILISYCSETIINLVL